MTESNRTPFDEILDGKIPCHRVYEDEHVLAFLDIFPISPGHTLVIPKEHSVDLPSTDTDALLRVAVVLPRIAAAVVAATGAEGFNVLQSNGACAGQMVGHIHFHIVPRREGDGIEDEEDRDPRLASSTDTLRRGVPDEPPSSTGPPRPPLPEDRDVGARCGTG